MTLTSSETQISTPVEKNKIRVGMLGFGTVGTGTYRMLRDNAEAISRKVGVPIEVVAIGIRDQEKPRDAPRDLFTTDLQSIVDNPDIDVIIELIGGLSPAGELIERALRNGKHVVTANKELIAKQGLGLINLAAEQSLDLHFEAAVGGGIPLIQPLKHQLAGNDVLKMMGILNGTTNYILTKMWLEGTSLEVALAEAQQLGYAEADPTSDVDGFDAQYKLAILASIAFGKEVKPEQVYREGIRSVTKEDINSAKILKYRIKLIGIVEAFPDGSILARVHPTLVPRKEPLANVHDVYNAVWIRGDFVGDVMFSGRGAGANPTGSAVVGDLIDVCRNIKLGGAGNTVALETGASTLPITECVCSYYLRMSVDDKPKALGHIATAFGKYDISLAAMEMRVIDPGENIGEIVFLTHDCREADFLKAVEDLRALPMVLDIKNWLRVEESD